MECKASSFSTFSPCYGLAWCRESTWLEPSSGLVVMSHCGFHMHRPSDQWCWCSLPAVPFPNYLGALCPSGWRSTCNEPGKLRECPCSPEVNAQFPNRQQASGWTQDEDWKATWEPRALADQSMGPVALTGRDGVVTCSGASPRAFPQVISVQDTSAPNPQTWFVCSTT